MSLFLPYIAFWIIWSHAKCSSRVWESFAHQANTTQKVSKIIQNGEVTPSLSNTGPGLRKDESRMPNLIPGGIRPPDPPNRGPRPPSSQPPASSEMGCVCSQLLVWGGWRPTSRRPWSTSCGSVGGRMSSQELN